MTHTPKPERGQLRSVRARLRTTHRGSHVSGHNMVPLRCGGNDEPPQEKLLGRFGAGSAYAGTAAARRAVA